MIVKDRQSQPTAAVVRPHPIDIRNVRRQRIFARRVLQIEDKAGMMLGA